MTRLMEQAIDRLRSLPETHQDRVAGFVLHELEQEAKWDETTQKYAGKLDQLATEILAADVRGECEPLDPDTL